VLDPELLVADEPVSMLDVSVRAGALTLLDGARRAGNMGVLMITHDLSTAAHFADRIAVMYLGRIVEEGPARDVVRNPQHPYTKALLSVAPKRDPRDRSTTPDPEGRDPAPWVEGHKLAVVAGTTASATTRGCRRAARCG
jgi:oligopeptide/dipeptide ABC transporter ATP-binding protein